MAARDKATDADESAGLKSPNLATLAVDAKPLRGLVRSADGRPMGKTQQRYSCAEDIPYTDPDSHLSPQVSAQRLQSDCSYLQVYNC